MTTVSDPVQLSPRYTAAVDYAREQHAAQVRKGSQVPYLAHLLAVSSLVLEHDGNEDQAIAGLLHDVLEDCGADQEEVIRERFGNEVADIVKACTDGTAESKGASQDVEAKRRDWWRRKLAYVNHLRHEPDPVLLVSGCDKLHNALAIVGDLGDPGVGLAVFDRFKGGITGTLRYYHSLSVILTKRNAPTARAVEAAVVRMHELASVVDRLPLDHGVYSLRIYDNFHYMDRDEAYDTGLFFSADEALAGAKARVIDDLVDARNGAVFQGIENPTADEVYKRYVAFGEDPSIVGEPPVPFSAWTFAKEMAPEIAARGGPAPAAAATDPPPKSA